MDHSSVQLSSYAGHKEADALYVFKSREFGGEYVGRLLVTQCDKHGSIHVLLSPFEAHLRETSVRIELI